MVDVFAGAVVKLHDDLFETPPDTLPCHSHDLWQSVAEIEQRVKKVNGRRGRRPDGDTLVTHVCHLIHRIIQTEEFKSAWNGANTKAYRLLLIQYHMGKVMVELLKRRVTSSFHRALPDGQYGGIERERAEGRRTSLRTFWRLDGSLRNLAANRWP